MKWGIWWIEEILVAEKIGGKEICGWDILYSLHPIPVPSLRPTLHPSPNLCPLVHSPMSITSVPMCILIASFVFLMRFILSDSCVIMIALVPLIIVSPSYRNPSCSLPFLHSFQFATTSCLPETYCSFLSP